MATNFPTSLDNLTNPAGSDPVNNPSHASQHANINDAIEVLEAKVGVTNSAVTTSLDYRVRSLETNPTYTNEMAQDAVAAALAAGTHTNITINYNDTGNSISISAAAGYTNEEAVDAVAAALAAGSGISISYNDPANTITIAVDSTIATKTYVDTAVSNLGSTAASTYVPQSDVGNPDGVASLDATGKIPDTEIPAGIARDSEVTSAISTEVTNRNSAISTAINNLINSAPGTLDTLGEIATALAADESAAASLTTLVNTKAPIASPTFTGTVSGITKSMVGLANVDNTTDANKPVSTAVQTALDLKANLASPTFTGDVVLPSTTTYNGTNIQTSLDSKSDKAKSVSTKTADYTLTTSDADSIIEFNSSSDLNLTLPTYSAAPFTYGSGFSIANRGTGKVNVLNQSGTDPLSSFPLVGITTSVYSTLYANGVYLAQSSSGYRRSYDGVTWVAISGITVTGSSDATQRIAYGNGLFVVNGNTGIWTSPDAITWTQRLTSSQTYSVKYANSKFFAGGSNGIMFTSTDGISWTSLGQIATANTTTFRNIEYLGSNTWYASSTSSGNSIRSTDNGQTWSSLSAPSGSFSLAYDGTTLVGNTVGSSTASYYVSLNNGTSWTSKSFGTTSFSSAPYYDGSKIYLAHSITSSPQTLKLSFIDATGALSVQSTFPITSFIIYDISSTASGGFLLLSSNATGYTAGSVTTSYISKNNGSYIPSKGRAEIYNYNQNQFVVSGNIDSVPYLETQYGGTGTVTSPSSGQVLYSASGSTYAPATLSDLVTGAKYQTTAPSSPAVGQIWIDSDEVVTTFDSNIIRRKAITATAGQTVFTADLPFIDGFEQIFMNGLLLVKTTDYAISGGNTVTLTSGAAASDIIEIVSVTGANSISTYTQAETNSLLAANTSVAPLSISANTTLVAKKRYFVTSASALTLTLPASPALNDEIQIVDASGNASTYNITVARNANKINGGNDNLIIDTNGGWYTLLYTGSTYGWKVG